MLLRPFKLLLGLTLVALTAAADEPAPVNAALPETDTGDVAHQAGKEIQYAPIPGFTDSAPVIVPFIITALIGLCLGLLNAAVVVGLKMPTLIATLGTQGIIRGILITYVGSRVISDLPASTAAVSTSATQRPGPRRCLAHLARARPCTVAAPPSLSSPRRASPRPSEIAGKT